MIATVATVALLALADGRFPSGGHAHSGGVEAAVTDGRVTGIDDLHAYLAGRLHTTGLVDACIAAATAALLVDTTSSRTEGVTSIVEEAEARCASPTLRLVNRNLGRQLLRTAAVIWPDDPLLAQVIAVEPDLPLAVAQGVVGHVAGLDAAGVAAVVAYQCVTGPATAAVRLLGLDPRSVHGLVILLASDIDAIVGTATIASIGDLAALPGPSSTLVELAAERHARAEARLFAS